MDELKKEFKLVIDSYSIYDYGTKTISKDLSKSELRAALSEYDTKRDAAKTAEKEKSASKEDARKPNSKISGRTFTENELRKNAEAVLKMKSVAELSGKEFSAEESGTLKEKVVRFFESHGNSVINEELGAVSLTASSFHDDRGHGLTRNKIISFAAIPAAIKNGKAIDVYQPKGSTYERITLAAPIEIEGKKFYIGVMIQRDLQSQRMYLHDVVEDVITEEVPPSFTNVASQSNDAVLRDGKHLYITSILKNALNVNKISEKTSENPSGKSVIAEINEYARKHIVGFDKLNAANKAVIRRIIRQGRARGVKESVLIDYANVAARAKIDVVFDKALTAQLAKTKDGEFVAYADAYYDPRNYRIVANPEAQTSDGVLIHELDHALRKSINGGRVTTKLYGDAIRAVDADKYQEIHNAYAKGKKMSLADKIALTEDEVEAHYARTALGDKGIVHHLVAKQPSVKDKILSFFKKASGDYIGAPNLQKQAMRYYKQYRKWFNEFAKERAFAVMGDATTKVDKGDLRYSTGKTFSAQVEDVISGTHNPRYDLYVSETPEYLVGLNFPSGPVLMRNSKVNEILKKHEEMSEEILKGVPLALKDPILVLKSKTHPTESVVVVTDVMTSKGEMIVPVWVNQDGSYVDVDFGEVNEKTNFVASAYGRNIKSLLQYANENDGFFYQTEDEKRVKNLLARNGLQLPTPLRISNSTIIIPETAEKSNPSDEKSSKKSEKDSEYMAAVNRGDMETAQKMVDEAAKAAMPKSQIKMPDGSLRKVYHGTNSGDFTVFNPDYIGMSSGDRGFFGKGFYFAYSKGEAKYYGAKRIISAYLNITNPFDFQRELQTFNGKRAGSGHAPDAVAFLNFAEKFPEIAAKSFVSVYNAEKGKDISLIEFAKAYRDVIENKRFEYQTVENEYGEKETVVLADKTVHSYDDNGVTRNYVDYGFQKRFWGDANELDVAYEYLSTVVYDYIDMYSRTRLVLDNNEEFTAKLREMGYDGAIQSVDGDEAVAFLPEQIKSADPVTYDDSGNVIPLSKRFDPQNPDIRYSLPLTDAKGNAVEYGDQSRYSYESLIEKGDLAAVKLPSELPMTPEGKIDNKAVVARGRLNARKQKNPNNTDTDTYVRVDDIGVDVLIGAKGLQHGLARSKETAFAVMKIGDVLKNSVAVNELSGSEMRKSEMSYMLLGACRDNENLYAVRSVVSKLKNDVTEIDVYQLGAVKGKKTEIPNSALKRGAAVTEQSSLISSGSPTVSIADFLEYVKNIPLINEVFSLDVVEKLGVDRTNGTLSDDLRFSLPLTDDKGNPIEYENVDIYNEKQYNNFGWARHSESLTKNELDDLYSKLQEKKILRRFKQSAQGEAIVEVNDKPHTTLGVDNVFVFVKGKATEPKITRVVRFRAETEIEMEIIKEALYERGTCSDTYLALYQKEEIAREYRRENSPTFDEYRKRREDRETRRGADRDHRTGAERGGDSRSSKDDVSFSLPLTDDKGNPIEYEDVINKGVPYAKSPDMTVGQMRKHIANTTHYKVFSKSQILEDVKKMPMGDLLKAETREQIAEEAT